MWFIYKNFTYQLEKFESIESRSVPIKGTDNFIPVIDLNRNAEEYIRLEFETKTGRDEALARIRDLMRKHACLI